MKKMAKRFMTGTGRAARRGFTLIEVLVTLAIVAILVAVLFPIVLAQLDDADPTRTARDLASIRSGIEVFQLNVRPETPGDLEDLVHPITTSDESIEGVVYTSGDVNRWRGPYLDLATPVATTASGDGRETGFGGNIQLELNKFESGANLEEGATGFTEANADWISVAILDISLTQFEAINDLIDGEDELDADLGTTGQSDDEGRLRFTDDRDANGTDDDPAVFYLAVPYRQ